MIIKSSKAEFNLPTSHNGTTPQETFHLQKRLTMTSLCAIPSSATMCPAIITLNDAMLLHYEAAATTVRQIALPPRTSDAATRRTRLISVLQDAINIFEQDDFHLEGDAPRQV